MRRNPAATQSNNLAAILQYEDEVTLYLIDTNANQVVGLLSMIDSSGVSERLIPHVGLSASAKTAQGSYGPLLYMMGLQFASKPQYFKKYIRGYEDGLDQEYEDQYLPPEEEPNFILINIEKRAIPYGLRPDGVPSPLAAKLWTRILADSDAYVPNSSIVATSLIDLGIPNPKHPDRRSSLNYVYKLVGPIYINGIQVDLDAALLKGFTLYNGIFDKTASDPVMRKIYQQVDPMLQKAMSNLLTDRKPYPTSFTIPL